MENAVKTEKGQANQEIQKLKKALEISEGKFAAVFAHTPLGISITRVRDNTVVEINASYAAFTGYTRDDIVGKKVTEMNIWADPSEREAILKRLKEKGRIENEEHDLRTRLGEIHPVLLSIEPINYMGEDCLLVTAVDIFRRRMAAAAVAESEEKFAKAFSVSANAMCITSLEDNKFFEINDAYTAFTGYSRTEVIDHTSAELNLWPFEEELKYVGALLQKDGKFQNVEFHSRRKDGEIRTGLGSAENITIHGKPYRLVVITDITERKKIEEALKESEEKFSKAFSASANAISISSIEDNRVLEINAAYTAFTGYSRQEAIGHTGAELNLWASDDEYKRVAELMIKTDKIQNFEFHSRHKSGEIRTGLVSGENITIGGKPCRIVVITDITERKKIEEALKESEEKFYKAFSASANAIGVIAIQDGKYIDANESFYRFTGYSREEIVGHNPAELDLWVYPEEQQKWISALRKDARAVNHEFHSRRKSGEIRIALASADIISIRGKPCRILSMTDITDLKNAEEALRESEEFNSTLLTNTPNAIFVTYPDGTIKYVNPAFEKLTGFSLAEIIGTKRPYPWWPEGKKLEIEASLGKTMQGKEIILSEQSTRNMTFQKKNGELFIVELNAAEINKNGRQQYIMVVWTDITEREKAEEKLNQTMGFLEQSNSRLAAANKELEAFSYSVSHDLRAPLRSIDGFSQALLEDYPDKLDATGQDYLKRVRNASQKMGELIDGMLRLSRLSRSELHIEKVDLGAIARDITGRLKENQPERNSDFIIEGDLTAQGDPQLLRAVLENLLGNAWKFTSKAPRAIIEFGVKQEGSKKVFYVKDNGAGFDMTYVDKLFGAFQRLHDVIDYPGTGIGLATVQRIINRHGGTVRAEGETGKGATFYFTLS